VQAAGRIEAAGDPDVEGHGLLAPSGHDAGDGRRGLGDTAIHREALEGRVGREGLGVVAEVLHVVLHRDDPGARREADGRARDRHPLHGQVVGRGEVAGVADPIGISVRLVRIRARRAVVPVVVVAIEVAVVAGITEAVPVDIALRGVR
jgi:hypothetical protein